MRNAKGKTTTNYYVPCDNPKESIEKRYDHFCHNFCEIPFITVEDEK